MNIAILEDKPLVMLESIGKMETMGIHTKQLIYYTGDTFSEEYQLRVQQKCEERNIEFLQVNKENFNEKMNHLYENPELIFFFDLILEAYENRRFEEWVNVIYAKKKRDENGDDGRIWFYTTGSAALIEKINMFFPNRNIPVERFKTLEQQTILDYEYVRTHIVGQE